MEHLLTFIILVAFFLFYWVYYSHQRRRVPATQWEEVPTKAQYLDAHPKAVNGKVLFCRHCGHHKQLEVGLVHLADFRREWACAKCKRVLFRAEDDHVA